MTFEFDPMYADALPMGTRIGDVVLGGAIGQGGEGIVYLGEHVKRGRVVVKEYWPKLIVSRSESGQVSASQPRWQAALREGSRNFEELGRRLCGLPLHQNVVEFIDVIIANQTAYLLMQHLPGAPLSLLLDEGRPLPPVQVLALAQQLCSGLAHLHAQGLIHRDVAPDNVIVDAGRAILIDLNAARDEERQVSLSLNGLVKPGYSPFEQYAQSAAELDARSDIYAASAVLIYAITGQKPREAAARMQNRETLDGALVAAAPAGFDPAFLAAVEHGFALFKQDRPASIAEWQNELFPEAIDDLPKASSAMMVALAKTLKSPALAAGAAGILLAAGLAQWQPWEYFSHADTVLPTPTPTPTPTQTPPTPTSSSPVATDSPPPRASDRSDSTGKSPPPPRPPSQVRIVGPFFISFDYDRADISPAAAKRLDQASANLGGCGSVYVTAFVDGENAYNQTLADRRAESVAAYLASRGISAARISTAVLREVGSVPVADGVRNEQNRRVEISCGPAS